MMDDVDEDDSSWFWQHIFYQLLWIQLFPVVSNLRRRRFVSRNIHTIFTHDADLIKNQLPLLITDNLP